MYHSHDERHRISRIGWLRAAIHGANDGIVSTASLIIGVAAASASTSEVLVAGIAGLVAGAMSWLRESMFLSDRSRTPNKPISSASAQS